METNGPARETPPGGGTAAETLLRVRGLRKSFGPVEVLRGVDLDLPRGRILGLVGENGAGKSTLVRCLTGYLAPDAGEVTLDGRAQLVPQEFELVESLSVAENMHLGREPRRGPFVDRAAQRAAASAALARIGAAALDPDAPIAALGVADRQKTEIAKGLLRRADLLVLDEPTTVLSRDETAALFAALRALRAEGVSMLYISHKLDEVLDLCDEVAVLRDGALVARGPSSGFTPAALAEAMVGRPLADVYPPRLPPPPAGAAPALRVTGLSDGARVLDATFDLFPGEILGLAGLAGAGRTELAELLCGLRPRRAGSLELFGAPVRFRSMRDANRAGLSYLSEDRQGTALLVDETIRANATLSSLRAYCAGPFVSDKRTDAAARRAIGELSIRCTGPGQGVRALSGGNQQKVAFAKSLDTAPRVLIVDEPTRGVDVGARAEIYRLLHDLAARGLAVLMISSDLPEILGNCRRALVMREGRIAGELADAALTEEAAIRLATGVTSTL